MIVNNIIVEIDITFEAADPTPKIIGIGSLKRIAPPLEELQAAEGIKISVKPMKFYGFIELQLGLPVQLLSCWL